jgi:hypothetical protein
MAVMIQEANLEARLGKIKEILEGSTNYLRAKVALQSAFSPAEDSKESDAALGDPPESSAETPGDKDEPMP